MQPSPPPRPPINVRPIDAPVAPNLPRRLTISAYLWIVSAVLALPTAWYATGHFDEASAALFDEVSTDLDPGDIDAAHRLADGLPTWVTIAAVVIVALQAVFAATMIAKRSNGARIVLALLGVVGLFSIAAWHYVFFGLPDGSDRTYELGLFLQALFLLAGFATMWGRLSSSRRPG